MTHPSRLSASDDAQTRRRSAATLRTAMLIVALAAVIVAYWTDDRVGPRTRFGILNQIVYLMHIAAFGYGAGLALRCSWDGLLGIWTLGLATTLIGIKLAPWVAPYKTSVPVSNLFAFAVLLVYFVLPMALLRRGREQSGPDIFRDRRHAFGRILLGAGMTWLEIQIVPMLSYIV